jgi:hypothetical protein
LKHTNHWPLDNRAFELPMPCYLAAIESRLRFSFSGVPTYANGEITHFLRDNGFLLKVPPTWRELHARGQRLLTSGVGVGEMLERLGISREQWIQIVDACSVRVVAFAVE